MAKKKRTINAKRFVEDYRSGKSREELMQIHALSHHGLEKVLRMLVDKNLLDPSELNRKSALTPEEEEDLGSYYRPVSPPPPDSAPVGFRDGERGALTQCPQCGAQANESALSCPECGHVLPGQERWEQVEPKKPLAERIPALVWGIIIAAPIGIALFFFFKDFMLPATEAEIDRRQEIMNRYKKKSQTPIGSAKALARKSSARVAELEVKNLIAMDVISDADKDYAYFTAGPGWTDLSQEEQVAYLSRIRSALKRARLPIDFELVDTSDTTLARVTATSIEIKGKGLPGETEMIVIREEMKESAERTQDDLDALREGMEQRFPGYRKQLQRLPRR